VDANSASSTGIKTLKTLIQTKKQHIIEVSTQRNTVLCFLLIDWQERSFINALQRQNAENLKQIFPEKEYRGLSPNFHIHVSENLKQIFPEKECWGLSPNFHIHVSVSELYISTMGLFVLLEEICRLILGIYITLKDT
jgi:hypothetical protein